MTRTSLTEGMLTWITVVQLLSAAADHGFDQADEVPEIHSLALGAQYAASAALALIPADLDLDDGPEPPGSVADLIRAAGALTRRHPIEDFPPGAASVLVAIGELVREAAP